MSANESRLAGAAPENLRGGGSAPSLATAAHSVAVLDGVVLTASELAAYVRGYIAGEESAEAGTRPDDYLRGWTDHARAVRAADEAAWAGVREVVARAASAPSYAELAETRGEPDRADRQRQLLAERGVSA